jgi:hypothetical protein
MQTTISSYFCRTSPLLADSCDLVHVDSSSSDDDAPLVSREHHLMQLQIDGVGQLPQQSHRQQTKRASHLAPQDGAAIVVAPSPHGGVVRSRQLYSLQGEAEEASDEDVEEESGSDDSFVVSDHSSVSGMSSSDDVPTLDQLHEICSQLRNRRHCVQCPQCLRLMRVIADFMSAINAAVPPGNHAR